MISHYIIFPSLFLMQVGKKQKAKKNKKIPKLQTETTDETEERSSVKENKSSQLKKKKLAEKKKKKKAEIRQKRLNKKKQKNIAQSSEDGKDISSDPVPTKKVGRYNKEVKVMKKTAKFKAKKGKAAKMTGKFITGKDVVNIWDEEEKTEEESHVTQEEGPTTQKRKRSGPGMTCNIREYSKNKLLYLHYVEELYCKILL